MGIRIKIKWEFRSPLLQIATGILKVEDIDLGRVDQLLFQCKVKIEPGMLGYSSLDKTDENQGIPHKLFEELRPTIDTMVRSYYQGMLLKKSSYEWIDDSLDKTFDEWIDEKDIPKGAFHESTYQLT